MSNGSGKPRKSISRNTKRMAAALLALIWIRHFKALTLITLQRIRQLKTQKLCMHVDGRQKKGCTVSRGRLCLMYVMHLFTMTMQLLLAQMSNRDGEAGMETMLWDIRVIPNGVKTTLERCGPFSLVVLSQRRSQVTPLSGHSDQNASETFSNKLQLNKVQSSLRQTSAKTTQVRSKAKTS